MREKMIQQEITGPGAIRYIEIPVPEVGSGQVLIRVKRIGICGSDIHVYHGKHPYVLYPVSQGHEVSGEVAAVGEGVSGLSIGDKVTIEPQNFCGRCYPCTHGKYNLCEELKVMGFQTTGAGSEYFLAEASKVVPLPEGMSLDEGAMIEPLAVTVHACKRSGDVAGKSVIVLGAGPIGILLCQTLKAYGAARVMVTDVSDYRLELAKQCGADFVCNTMNADFGKAVIEYLGPDKADIIYDCAGNDITMDQAIQNARKGSVIMLIAVFAGMATVDLAKLNDSEIDLMTSMMYRHEDYVDAIRIVGDGLVDLKPLISKHFAFADFVKAYEYIDQNREQTMKVLIDID